MAEGKKLGAERANRPAYVKMGPELRDRLKKQSEKEGRHMFEIIRRWTIYGLNTGKDSPAPPG